ncbi:MAG: hypothetical protein WC651_05060 [Candidatus Gracilibacteria bacterium]|jgi:hypothetical protein
MTPELDEIKRQLNILKNAIVQIEWQIQKIEGTAEHYTEYYLDTTTADKMKEDLRKMHRDPTYEDLLPPPLKRNL